jgi:hypothetical protein
VSRALIPFASPPTRRSRCDSGDLPLKGGGEDQSRAALLTLTSPLEGEVASEASRWGVSDTIRVARRISFRLCLVALLTLPLFAHGCHGDDIDHEPLLIPTRFNPDDS